ncbi:hypothetical protein AB0J90_17365 [Micromonospora sp. NPDC049523]|uniref:hypothetical protein n=1 Tax=Micromonospora sp. NPDC049523 TaxID=3155921 RepID=UPI00343F85FA
MRQGEIRPYRPIGPRRELYVLVVSADEFNTDPMSRPICVDVVPGWPASGISIPLTSMDPVEGVVRVATIGSRSRDALGEPVGMITGQTLARVWEAFHVILDLPGGTR